MNNSSTPYNLVHIITGSEYKAPLLASQVFDRAQVQAVTPGKNKPASVSVWIIVPMRELFDKTCLDIVNKLKLRCPDINIKMVGGISRLNNWPAIPKLSRLRKSLKTRTVFHSRGESSFVWSNIVKGHFKGDANVLDVRGYWPLERYVDAGVFEEKDMSSEQKVKFNEDSQLLRDCINNADAVCTVSEPLRQYIIKRDNAPQNTSLIPCCVKNTIADTDRERIREELNLGTNTAILYLGGTQKYQHVDDLVIPFIKSAISQSESHIGVFLTQNKDNMMALIKKHGLNEDRIRLLSVSQDKVGKYLTAMDMGLLLRAPNSLNNFSQPVKFGEYLSAGLPVILEEGTGSIAAILAKHKIGCVVKLSGKTNSAEIDTEVKKALDWVSDNKADVRQNTVKFVEDNYTWNANLPIERQMYIEALEKQA